MLTTPAPGDLDEVVRFVVDQQRRPERNVMYLGTEVEGVTAELEGIEPAWSTTARVARDAGRIVGAVAVEWDLELGRSWVMGPWVAHEDDRWLPLADELLDTALAGAPPGVVRHEMGGDIAKRRLAELAERRGWWATETNHALAVDDEIASRWEVIEDTRFRAATVDDLEGIRALHDIEFPGTYASAEKLVAGEADGSRTTMVAHDGAGEVAAYASGHLQDDGEGYLDFLVVHPDHLGQGLGRQAVVTIARDLLPRSPLHRVSLTVQDHRTPARSLYERLGFRHEASFVAYRSWES